MRSVSSIIGIESLDEILTTIRRNKLRTLLTGLSVAWGMFMLALLLGAGRGLEQGVEWEFRDDAQNSIWVYSSKTSKPYAGLSEGREVRFMNDDYEALGRDLPGVDHVTGRFYLWGEFTVSYRDKSSAFDIRGTHPDHRYLEKTVMVKGRYLNDTDIRERRTIGAGALPNTAANLSRWIPNAQSIKEGSRMPPIAVSPDDVRAIVSYLESLK